MVGLPYFLSRTTFRPLGPSVALTACAMMLTPRRSAARASSLNRSCLAMGLYPSSRVCTNGVTVARPRGSRAQDAEHVLLPHGEVLLAVQLDLAPGVLAEQDAVSRLDVERELLAGLGHLAGADRDHLALLGLFFGGVGDDDAPVFLLPLGQTLDEDAVVERAQRGLRTVSHRWGPPWS